MAHSAFADKSSQPTSDDVRKSLGKAHAAWQRLITAVSERIGPVDEVWAFSGKSIGWGMRLKKGDRIILYMTPQDSQFLVSLALGEKAVRAAKATDLPESIISVIDAAPRYAEGRGVRFTVSGVRDVKHLAALAAIKDDPSKVG